MNMKIKQQEDSIATTYVLPTTNNSHRGTQKE